jgi:hypothetical protein
MTDGFAPTTSTRREEARRKKTGIMEYWKNGKAGSTE